MAGRPPGSSCARSARRRRCHPAAPPGRPPGGGASARRRCVRRSGRAGTSPASVRWWSDRGRCPTRCPSGTALSARDTTVRPDRGCRPAPRQRPSALTHARPAGSPSPQAPPSRDGPPSAAWWGRADPRVSPRSDAGPRRARPTTLATDEAGCLVPAGYQTVSTRPLFRMRPSRVTSGSCSESAVATMSLSHGSRSRSRLMPVQASATSVSTG